MAEYAISTSLGTGEDLHPRPNSPNHAFATFLESLKTLRDAEWQADGMEVWDPSQSAAALLADDTWQACCRDAEMVQTCGAKHSGTALLTRMAIDAKALLTAETLPDLVRAVARIMSAHALPDPLICGNAQWLAGQARTVCLDLASLWLRDARETDLEPDFDAANLPESALAL